MDDPENPDERTIINVKSVKVRAWERGKSAANRAGETMGEWLTKAIETQVHLEAGRRVFPPDKPEANPANLSPAPLPPDLREIVDAIAAVAGAGIPIQKHVVEGVNAVLYAKLLEAASIDLQTVPQKAAGGGNRWRLLRRLKDYKNGKSGKAEMPQLSHEPEDGKTPGQED